ncbi:hypothetical protein C3L33_05649, partial [Rhododendron williamsianum]
MFPILEKIDGISLETMMLLWSMKEKHNPDSKFKLYFDALPEVFNTGLSFGVNAIMALDGTLLLEETVQAKEHLRTQYDELFPALCNDHPGIFPTELYSGISSYGLVSYDIDATITDCSKDCCPLSSWTNHMENLETELEILEALRSTFEDMLETLGRLILMTGNSIVFNSRSTSWDVKLAMEFKDQQRRIVSSIVTSCNYGCKLLEDELLKK